MDFLTNVLLFRSSNDGFSRGSNCSEFLCSAPTMVVPSEIRPLPFKISLCPSVCHDFWQGSYLTPSHYAEVVSFVTMIRSLTESNSWDHVYWWSDIWCHIFLKLENLNTSLYYRNYFFISIIQDIYDSSIDSIKPTCLCVRLINYVFKEV